LRKVCVTNQFFNGTARRHAEINDVETVDQRDLERLLAIHDVRKPDVDTLLLADWDKAAWPGRDEPARRLNEVLRLAQAGDRVRPGARSSSRSCFGAGVRKPFIEAGLS
jgi:hypothetical protein